MRPPAPGMSARLAAALRAAIHCWALAGGIVLVAVVAINVIGVAGAVFGAPFPGAFELTEAGVAVAVFAFLPYCQLTGANVTADIFTARAPRRARESLRRVAGAPALAIAAILLWRMQAGMLDKRDYGHTTAILQLPLWWAYVPALVSLALLGLAATLTLLGADEPADAP